MSETPQEIVTRWLDGTEGDTKFRDAIRAVLKSESYWQEEARRYSQNATFQQEQRMKAEAERDALRADSLRGSPPYYRLWQEAQAEVERLTPLADAAGKEWWESKSATAMRARAEKAEAALRQIAAWSWDSGSTPAPEVVSRIYCEARAVLRDSAPGGKP